MGGIPLGCEDCLRREHFSLAGGVRGAERQWGCSPWTLRGEAGPEGDGQGLWVAAKPLAPSLPWSCPEVPGSPPYLPAWHSCHPHS